MTANEKAQIEQLAARGFSARRIAIGLNRHPATVRFFMLQNGLVEYVPNYSRRKLGLGRTCYGPEEDRELLTLRKQGKGVTFIAAAMTEKFGIRRNAHSVSVRLVMLATSDKEP